MGGNVLLRRVREDSPILLNQQADPGVTQVGEIVGLGDRWTQDSVWNPPVCVAQQKNLHQSRRDYLWGKDADGEEVFDPRGGHLDPDWKPTYVPERPRTPGPRFTPAHRASRQAIKVGALVVFINARVYEVFRWETEDLLVYPGNWILGVIEGSYLADHPDARRYAEEPA